MEITLDDFIGMFLGDFPHKPRTSPPPESKDEDNESSQASARLVLKRKATSVQDDPSAPECSGPSAAGAGPPEESPTTTRGLGRSASAVCL